MKLAAWILLGLAGLLAHAVDYGSLARPKRPDLDRISVRLGSLERVEDVVFDLAVLGELPPEEHLFRRYRDERGHEGLVYIAYFLRGKRWSGRPHPVDVCFLSQGWENRHKVLLDTPQGAQVWVQDFEREGRNIRVLHWLQRPGDPPRMGLFSSFGARLGRFTNLRQDVASIYFEFDAEAAPPDDELAAIADQLVRELEQLWK